MSGVACALSAARQGARVILLQDRPMLGGNASSEVRMHIVGANSHRSGADQKLETRESGIIEEIRLENSFRNPQRSPSMFDQILYEKCVAEPGLTVMLDTRVVNAAVEKGRITEAEAVRLSTEDYFRIEAKVFVDCTGDGGLGAAAGAAFQHGREAKETYGESLARDTADSHTLGSTLLLMARKHDHPVPFIAPPWARKFTEEDLRLRRHAELSETDYGLEYGFYWIEWGGQLDTIKDNDRIRHELLAIVMGIWDHIKNDGDHGAECWALDWFGAVPGKRESRRFFGQHILTEHDLMQSRPHPDAIAYGGWAIDLHPPNGVDASDEPPYRQTKVPQIYDIPLRSCVARDISNLMFAGRNISASHVAFASTRVMATCAVIGEGVGVAAAYAVESDLPPASLAGNPVAISEIQQRIVRQDAFLIGLRILPDDNLAALARISASSEQPDGLAREVLSGQNRTVLGEEGVGPDREIPGTHRWMSVSLPASLEFQWPEAVSARRVEVVFDSGLHRHLTLTQSSAYTRVMHWGTGQPELARSYRIEILSEGEWILVADETLNWQRWRSYDLPKKPFQALRIVVSESWDIDHARIVSVRIS